MDWPTHIDNNGSAEELKNSIEVDKNGREDTVSREDLNSRL